MGGNCSYSAEWGGVPAAQRSHTDTNYKVDGHKVLLQIDNNEQIKNILNSNSDSPIYLIAKTNKDGCIQIESINVFDGHNLSYEINLVFDENGDIVPFNGTKGTHAHQWSLNPETGMLERKSHDSKNIFAVDKKYEALIAKIVEFNKKQKKLK